MCSRPALETTIAELSKGTHRMRRALEESRLDTTEDVDDFEAQSCDSDGPVHPANIRLRRPGYYTIPALDELVDCVDENGDCFVENFVIGREGYGNVLFPGIINVANLNLDEIGLLAAQNIFTYNKACKIYFQL